MADEIVPLAAEFPPVSHEDWLRAVEKTLRGGDVDSLRDVTPDGIVIEPLYTLGDERVVEQAPASGTSRRAGDAAGLLRGWDVRQRHGSTAPAVANEAILRDLRRGVTSIELEMAGIDTIDTLDTVLAEVLLDLATVALRSRGDGVGQARMLLDLVERRGLDPGSVAAELGCDPIGSLASHGSCGIPVDDALRECGELAATVAVRCPRTRTFCADATPYAGAGATPATELAVTVATALAYVRAATDAGLDVADAFAQVVLSVSVGTEQFAEIAKLRALRVMWERVCEASGAADARATVQATMAPSVMTRRDPWVNMLRGTVACFAAAAGGADTIVVLPFDSLVGIPDELGLRVARNTQLALMEETNLHRVIDPGGGSWYIETLTDQLASVAWDRFRDLERGGGIVEALRAGTIQAEVSRAWARTERAVATRARAITGVSEFPHVDETPLDRRPRPSWPSPGEPREAEPLVPRRLAEAYEALRDAADASTPVPTVFLANLGPVADHTARATWAKNFFEAGGIRAVGSDGHLDADPVAAAFEASGAPLAVICSSDAVYADHAAVAARALVGAGAQRVYLAGRPRDLEDELRAAGVHDFVHVGCDALAVLRSAHSALGITEAHP